MRKIIPVALLLSVFLSLSVFAPCEEAVNPELTGSIPKFRLLGWSDSFAFFSLSNSNYQFNELNVFETTTLGSGEVRPVKRIRIPVRPRTVTVLGNDLYVTDSLSVFRFTPKMATFEPVQTLCSLVEGGRCALSKKGLLAIARGNEIAVFKISGEQVTSLNIPLHIKPESTKLLWAGISGIVVFDESESKVIVSDIVLGVQSVYYGISSVSYIGDGFFGWGVKRE